MFMYNVHIMIFQEIYSAQTCVCVCGGGGGGGGGGGAEDDGRGSGVPWYTDQVGAGNIK